MRFRFSLRLLLILLTVIAIGVGIWTQLVLQVKEQVRRHKAAVVKLKEMHVQLEDQKAPKPLTAYESFVRRWIDAEAFAPAPDVVLGWPLYKNTDDLGNYGRYESKVLEEILEIVKDVQGVPNILISVDRLTLKAARLIAVQTKLDSLYIDCRQIEPGATRELATLRQLSGFCMPAAIDEDAMLVLRRHRTLDNVMLNLSKVAPSHADLLAQQTQLKGAILIKAGKETCFLKALASQDQLARLVLFECDVDREAAKVFAQFPLLETLEIDGAGSIEGDRWSSIAKATHLKTLDVTLDTRPSAEGVQALAKCSKLEALNLEAVILTGDDLRAFSGHSSLQQIRFRGKISDREIEAFLRATPNCAVGMYKPDSEGFGLGKTGRGLRGKFYRLVNGKVDSSTNVFLEMVRP